MDSELIAWRQQAVRLADVRLMTELQQLVKVERSCEAQLLVLLAELDARQLYLAQGYSSLFRYAVSVLRMSEAQAYLRIRAARVARAYPVALEMLVEGALNLSTLKLLAPHLTADNHVALLERARDKNKQDVEMLVAEVAPQPDVPSRLRKLPAVRATSVQAELQMSAPRNQSSERAQASVAVTASHAAVSQGAQQASVASAAVPTAAAAQVAPAAVTTFALEAPRASCTVLRPARYKLEMTANQELYDHGHSPLNARERYPEPCVRPTTSIRKWLRPATEMVSRACSRTRLYILRRSAAHKAKPQGSRPQLLVSARLPKYVRCDGKEDRSRVTFVSDATHSVARDGRYCF
jgi:hypothetical protein